MSEVLAESIGTTVGVEAGARGVEAVERRDASGAAGAVPRVVTHGPNVVPQRAKAGHRHLTKLW